MPHPLEQLRDNALREIGDAPDEKTLEAVRVRYLGKSGSISVWGEKMKTLSQEERPVVGKLLNETRNAVADAIEQHAEKLRSKRKRSACQYRRFTSRHTQRARIAASPDANTRSRHRNLSPNGLCARGWSGH